MKHGKTKIEQIKFLDNTVQTTAAILNPLKIKTITGDYNLTGEDMLNYLIDIEVSIGETVNIIFPSDLSVPCDIGTAVIISSNGAGLVNLVPGNNAIINTPQSLTISNQYGKVEVIKTEPNTWEVDGELIKQNQVFIFPIHSHWTSKIFDLTSFTPLLPTNLIISDFTFGLGNGIFIANNIDNLNNNLLSTAENTDYIFANVPIFEKYVRATVIAGGVSLLHQTVTIDNEDYIFYAEGEWAQFLDPTVNTSANLLNPKYKLNQLYQDNNLITLQFDISNTPDDLNIIGSFQATRHPLKYNYFIEDFSATVDTNYFYINWFGDIFKSTDESIDFTHFEIETDYSLENRFSTITAHPEFKIEIDSQHGIFLRVSALSGVDINPGTGQLNTIYSFDSFILNNLSTINFGRDDNYSSSAYLVEILLDDSGILIPKCSGVITLNRP